MKKAQNKQTTVQNNPKNSSQMSFTGDTTQMPVMACILYPMRTSKAIPTNSHDARASKRHIHPSQTQRVLPNLTQTNHASPFLPTQSDRPYFLPNSQPRSVTILLLRCHIPTFPHSLPSFSPTISNSPPKTPAYPYTHPTSGTSHPSSTPSPPFSYPPLPSPNSPYF